jgi:hypothetical protein
MEAPSDNVSAATSEGVLLTQGSLEETFQHIGGIPQQRALTDEEVESIPPLYTRSWSASSSSSSCLSSPSFDSNLDSSRNNWDDEDSIPEAYSRGRSASESSYSSSSEGEMGSNSSWEVHLSSTENLRSTKEGSTRLITNLSDIGKWDGLVDVHEKGDLDIKPLFISRRCKEGGPIGHSACTGQGSRQCNGRCNIYMGNQGAEAENIITYGIGHTSTEEVDSFSLGEDSRPRCGAEEEDDSGKNIRAAFGLVTHGEVMPDQEENDDDSMPDLTTRQYSSEDSTISYLDSLFRRRERYRWVSNELEDEISHTLDDSMPSLEDYPITGRDSQRWMATECAEDISYSSDDSMPSLEQVGIGGIQSSSSRDRNQEESTRKADIYNGKLIITSQEWSDILLDSMHMMESLIGEGVDIVTPKPLRSDNYHGPKDPETSWEDKAEVKTHSDKEHHEEDRLFSDIMKHYGVNLGHSHSIEEQNDFLGSMITSGYLDQHGKHQPIYLPQWGELDSQTIFYSRQGYRFPISLQPIRREDSDEDRDRTVRKYAGLDEQWETIGSSKEDERSGMNNGGRSSSPPRLKDPPERIQRRSQQARHGQEPPDDPSSDSNSESSVSKRNSKGSCKEQGSVSSESSSTSSYDDIEHKGRQQGRTTKPRRSGSNKRQEARSTKGDVSDTRKKSRKGDTRGKELSIEQSPAPKDDQPDYLPSATRTQGAMLSGRRSERIRRDPWRMLRTSRKSTGIWKRGSRNSFASWYLRRRS